MRELTNMFNLKNLRKLAKMILSKLLRIIPRLIRKFLTIKSHFLFYSELKKYLNKQSITIIALPTIDWNTPLFQRPQHLAIQLAKSVNFIFCTYNHKYDHVYGIRNIGKNLIITNLWEDSIKLRPKSWFLLLSTQQLITIEQIKDIQRRGGKIIYDYVDEIHVDISGTNSLTNFLVERHQYIKESGCAEFVMCVSKRLYDEMLMYYPPDKVALIPNGVDYKHFQVKRDVKNIPADLTKIISSGQPIIGYYGAMANWLDYNLINRTAKNHPEWQFVFIGIDYNGGLKKLNQRLKNINFLGHKNYEELPKYGIWFDVSIIPFSKGEIAKSTSPLKMFEYMAMKKLVVATEDLIECHNHHGVLISKNKTEDFATKIKSALSQGGDKDTLRALSKQAQHNDWSNIAKEILKKLNE